MIYSSRDETNQNQNFCLRLFKLINIIRKNPDIATEKIIQSKINIKEINSKIYFYTSQDERIILNRGIEHFDQIASLMSKLQPLPPLEYREDLSISIPDDPNEWKNNKIISELLTNKIKEGKYEDYAFNLDFGVNDPEKCLLLQIIDDSYFKGKRRETLIKLKLKYIAISSKQVNNKFFCIISMAA